jgi:hypothetical protein
MAIYHHLLKSRYTYIHRKLTTSSRLQLLHTDLLLLDILLKLLLPHHLRLNLASM